MLYDGILKLDMPEDCFLDAYADVAGVIIAARNQEMTQVLLNRVMRIVSQ